MNKSLALVALVITIALLILPFPVTRTNASDHIDSPIITQDRGSDIADTYAVC